MKFDTTVEHVRAAISGPAGSRTLAEALELVAVLLTAPLPATELGDSVDLGLAALHVTLAAEELAAVPADQVSAVDSAVDPGPVSADLAASIARDLLTGIRSALRRMPEPTTGAEERDRAAVHVQAALASLPEPRP